MDTLLVIAREETNGYAALEAVNAMEYVCVDLIAQGRCPADLAERLRQIDPDRDYVPESKINRKLVAWPQRVINHILDVLADES